MNRCVNGWMTTKGSLRMKLLVRKGKYFSKRLASASVSKGLLDLTELVVISSAVAGASLLKAVAPVKVEREVKDE